jgi:hypothetical protein
LSPSEFGADLIGIWELQIVGDSQGLLPCLAGEPRLSVAVVGIAEMGQNVRPEEAVIQFPEESEGLLVADDGFGVLAKVVTRAPSFS